MSKQADPQAESAVFIVGRLRIGRPAKILLVFILDCYNRGDFLQARQPKLGAMLGISRRHVQRALYELRDKELITVRRRQRRPNVYELGPAMLAKLRKKGKK